MKRKLNLLCFIVLVSLIFTIGFFHIEQRKKEDSERISSYLDKIEYELRSINTELVFHFSNLTFKEIREIPPSEGILDYAILYCVEMGLNFTDIRGTIHFQYIEIIDYDIEECGIKINTTFFEPEYSNVSLGYEASNVVFQLGFNTSVLANYYNISKGLVT